MVKAAGAGASGRVGEARFACADELEPTMRRGARAFLVRYPLQRFLVLVLVF